MPLNVPVHDKAALVQLSRPRSGQCLDGGLPACDRYLEFQEGRI